MYRQTKDEINRNNAVGRAPPRTCATSWAGPSCILTSWRHGGCRIAPGNLQLILAAALGQRLLCHRNVSGFVGAAGCRRRLLNHINGRRTLGPSDSLRSRPRETGGGKSAASKPNGTMTSMCINIYIYRYTCMYTYIYIYIYICVYRYVHTYTCRPTATIRVGEICTLENRCLNVRVNVCISGDSLGFVFLVTLIPGICK